MMLRFDALPGGGHLMQAAPTRVVVYTVVKAASMFLHQLTTEISRRMRIPYSSINDPALLPKIKAASWKGFIEAHEGPAFFGPIRVGGMEPSLPEHLETYSVIVQVRDPRDVMTSLFFSQVYSHPPVPGVFEPTDDERLLWQERGIDEFVISRIPQFRLRYDMLCTLFGKPGVTSLRYEDLIDDYGTWLKGFLAAFYPSDPPPNRRRSILSRD